MTKKEMFTELLTLSEVAARPELVKGIKHEIDLLNRKNAGTRKPTARQEENEALIKCLKAILFRAPESGLTITEICKELDQPEVSHSRVNQLVKQLKDSGIVVREEIKRKAYFRMSDEAKANIME